VQKTPQKKKFVQKKFTFIYWEHP